VRISGGIKKKWRESGQMRLRKRLRRFGLSEAGATAIEYGLIAALIAVVIIAALRLTGNSLKTVFNNVGGVLNSAAN
jgi:pilus assembly protein Flp/PilA